MSSSSPVSSIFELAPISHGAKFISGYAFKSSDFTDTGIPVIKIKNIQGGVVTVGGSQCVPTSLITEKIKKFETKSGDVLIAMTGQGSVGRVGRVICKKEQRLMLNQRVGRFVADERTLNIDYLYYVISSEPYEQFLFDRGAGSGQPNLSPENIMSVEIPFPDYKQQVEISTILNSLDSRIALLRETNATLEAIAQSLFKSWFVDFDPVHANAGTQTPSLPPEIQALFPATFTNSPQGPIPEGWKVRTVGDVIETLGGATPDTKNEEYWYPSEIAWTSPKDLSGLNTPVLLATERRISQKGLTKISSGLLPKGTLLMSSRAPIGYLAIAQIPLAINQGYIAMPPGGVLPPLYMLFWCRTNMELIENRANGSTFMEISKKAFKPIELIVPPIEIIDQFMSNATPLFEKLIENEQQAKNLESLRDTLLPRLISGQLRLPEAEQAIAAITD